MCTAKLLKSPTCEHWWAEILKPCADDRNFGNCPSFQDGKARNLKTNPWTKAEKDTCPKCDKKGDYDSNATRMVKGIQYGYRWGTGPNKSDRGVDLLTPGGLCCIVM